MSADEQPRGDLGVRQSVAGEARDLSFLGGELIPGLDSAFADTLSGGKQLALGASGEPVIPIALNISNAVRSCSRASRRRRTRRSHSP